MSLETEARDGKKRTSWPRAGPSTAVVAQLLNKDAKVAAPTIRATAPAMKREIVRIASPFPPCIGTYFRPLSSSTDRLIASLDRLLSNEGKEQTLHELWDSGMLGTEHGSAKALASRFDQEVEADERAAWESGRPRDWANESIAINTRYVYPLPENHEISEEYAKRALPILHKRLVQAGVWLAWLLNEGLK